MLEGINEVGGVGQAVKDANGAHIRVVMITGDYVRTAVSLIRVDIPYTFEDNFSARVIP